ncbi:MAG: hypothetical protein U0871_28705 [Gemmataceae bacterium]
MPLLVAALLLAQPTPAYVKKATRADTVRATLAAHKLPTLDGPWSYAGPFDNTDGKGFDAVYPPEQGFDPKAAFVGKDGAKFGWKPAAGFELGKRFRLLPLFPDAPDYAVVYLYHEFTATAAVRLPVSLGSDDTLSVWFNGKRLHHESQVRGVAPDQDRVELSVRPGVNRLLIKVCQYDGQWDVYVAPELSPDLPPAVVEQVNRDFPPRQVVKAADPAAAEAKAYRVDTFAPPADCVLEVGGLAFRPDGKLLACTRRGDVWLIHNPTSDPAQAKFTRFATGLHEPLGMYVVDDRTVYVAQRPELTKLVDTDGDGVADRYETVSDRWGVSGDYHEYAFGPAVDKSGSMYLTLNVGFGGGHQAKAAWRGWCVKIDPKTGAMEPFAYGLRSPNGITVAPNGDLFYADNQGEWVATNKLCHLKRGSFYGHQAPLKWLADSPFRTAPATVKSGMWYDGTDPRNPTGPKTFPAVEPPAIWFPFARMGQSASEPVWDTTGGKFGPFAGQCFVGDQNRAVVMRVALEKVNGVYQGACFPFRGGLQCGVNRLCFGPDGGLYVGETARGWGGVGGKPYGLQRIAFTGATPFEVHSVKLTKTGFDLHFTKPLDPKALPTEPVAVKSWTYVYHITYGCPETDPRAEAVSKPTLSADRKTLAVTVGGRQKGRVYELQLAGVKSADGDPLLHPEAFYTLNELVK